MRYRGRYGRVAMIVFLCIFVRPLGCFAEKVILKSGQEEEGRIIDKNPQYIVLYANGVSKALPFSDIERIVETELSNSVSAQKGAAQMGAEGQINNVCKSTNACCALGTTALFNRESDIAIKFFDDAIRYDPKNAAAYEGRGRARVIKGDKAEDQRKEYLEALKDADEAVRFAPSRASGWLLRAKALRKLGRSDESIVDCEKAMAINPHSSGAYSGRAAAYYVKGDYDSAIRDYSKAIALTNEKVYLVPVISERAGAYVKKGDLVRAEVDCDRAMQLNPNYPFVHEVRAWIYSGRKEYDQAWAEVRKVQELGATVKPAFLEELEKNAPPS